MKDYKRWTTKNKKGSYIVGTKDINNVIVAFGELEDKIEDGTLVEWKHKKECLEELNKLNTQLFKISQKMEQGRLIELPVKIGDTVYKIDSDIDHEWGKDSHRCTIKYYPRAVKIKNHAELFYFMSMREEDLMFETEKEAFEQLKRQKNSLEEMYADKEFIDEVLVELRGAR